MTVNTRQEGKSRLNKHGSCEGGAHFVLYGYEEILKKSSMKSLVIF